MTNHKDCFKVKAPFIFEKGDKDTPSKGTKFNACPTDLFGPGVGRISENEVLFAGGNKDLECWSFNSSSKEWKNRGNLPKGHMVCNHTNASY